MADWQTAMQQQVAANPQSSAEIRNEEFSDLTSRQAGFIIGDKSGQDYVVGNPDTHQSRFGLSRDQVEPAMEELNIANSSWT